MSSACQNLKLSVKSVIFVKAFSFKVLIYTLQWAGNTKTIKLMGKLNY